MKRFAFLLLSLAVVLPLCFTTSGCRGGKPDADDSLGIDTLGNASLAGDTLEDFIDSTQISRRADELFNDFFFTFIGNRKYQAARVKFPLPVNDCGRHSQMNARQWKYDQFFMRDGYYTLIYEDEKQAELEKDTSLMHVVVEKIDLQQSKMECYVFDCLNGKWMLTALNMTPLSQSKNASFLAFYGKFSTDAEFQQHSLADEVKFSTGVNEDSFEPIEGFITPEQWESNKPGLIPQGLIYNIMYGQEYAGDHSRVLIIRGVANGFESEMKFEKKGGKWKLVYYTA